MSDFTSSAACVVADTIVRTVELGVRITALTDTATCPVAMLLTAGQAGDNPQLLPLVDGYFRTEQTSDGARDVRLLADKAYSHPSTARRCAVVGSSTRSPSVPTRSPGARPRALPVAAHPPSTPQSTSNATPSSAASTGSSNGAA